MAVYIVYIYIHDLMECGTSHWHIGLAHRTGTLDWHIGLAHWTGTLDWHIGLAHCFHIVGIVFSLINGSRVIESEKKLFKPKN